jgi:spoIIIJ-associated protein
MEWLETTAKSVDEAKDWLLDHLGVDASDAEFDVVEEPRAGLFGRVKGEARVRARVRPTPVRQKLDRRDRKRRDRADSAEQGASSSDRHETAVVGASTGASASRTGQATRQRPKRQRGGGAANGQANAGAPANADASVAPQSDASDGAAEVMSSPSDSAQHKSRGNRRPTRSTPSAGAVDSKEPDVSAQQVGEEAQRFMDGLVEAFGLSGRTEVVLDGDDIEVQVHGDGLGLLVGPRGLTLQAVQDLARVASQRRLGDHDTRLRVDVGGYRERRREALGRFVAGVAADVIASGEPKALEPMTSSDRKIVHDTLSTIEGISTRSEGDDPNRRVVISPAHA